MVFIYGIDLPTFRHLHLEGPQDPETSVTAKNMALQHTVFKYEPYPYAKGKFLN